MEPEENHNHHQHRHPKGGHGTHTSRGLSSKAKASEEAGEQRSVLAEKTLHARNEAIPDDPRPHPGHEGHSSGGHGEHGHAITP